MAPTARPPVERSLQRERSLDWLALLGEKSVDGALDRIASHLEARSGELELRVTTGEERRTLAARAGGLADGKRVERTLAIEGDPPWTLRVLARPASIPGARALADAGARLAAWRASRDRVAALDAGLEARTRELTVLQSMAARAADARTSDGLLTAAAGVLHDGEVIDLLAFLPEDPSAEPVVFLGRPLPEDQVEAWIGPASVPRTPVRIERLDGFDSGRGVREGVRDDALVAVPLERRGSRVARLIAVLAPPVVPAKRRLVYAAANQVAVHLDRILTVQEAEEGRFRSVLDSMPQAVLRTDSRLRVVHANAAALDLLRAARGGLVGGALRRVGDLDASEVVSALLSGAARSVAAEARTEDGRVLEVTVSSMADGNGGPDGLVFVLSDVTERRRLQGQLAQAEKLSSLGQMISGIAHELNNPLTAVVGFAQLAHKTAGDERLARRLDTVHREALRCQKIVQNLLAFARRHEPVRKLLSLNEVADAVLTLLDYQLRVAGVRVERSLDRALPAIQGDPHELQQALLNLLTNAQHALAGRGGGVVVVRTERTRDGSVSLSIEDDGPGIPAEIRSRIFDPFFTTKAAGEGTGLGLSIVYGIVAAHGGTIVAEERPGGGARFRLELPRVDTVPTERTAPEAESGAVSTRGRILVVDDEEPVARLICEALAEDGHDAISAFDGREALDRMAAERFDLIISDLRMPGLAAERMCEQMDQLEQGLSRKLVLTTGDTLSREADAIAERAGLAILHKPFDLQHLRRTVRSRLAARAER